jgi:protein involved in polysaccharide export with SLBB domain
MKTSSLTRVAVPVLLALCLATASLGAQEAARQLRPGDRVRVSLFAAPSAIEGQLLSTSADTGIRKEDHRKTSRRLG